MKFINRYYDLYIKLILYYIMKKLLFILLSTVFIVSCQQNETKTKLSKYPDDLSKIFKAHGGLANWNEMNTLIFGMIKPNGKEITTTNLKTRASLIDAPNYLLGNTGEALWVKSKDTTTYKGNAKFYNGLMFYFYSMPFILSDNGIIYKETTPLQFEGKNYPGILISYKSNVGVSPDDQYIIYYNPDTFEMEWLAYTVTFTTKQKSNTFKYIRYNNWVTLNGLKLPKSIDWYITENNQPTTKRNTVVFTDLSISKSVPNKAIFAAPKDAEIIK